MKPRELMDLEVQAMRGPVTVPQPPFSVEEPLQCNELTPDLSKLEQHYSDHYDRDCIFMAGL